MSDILVFGKWSADGIVVTDMGIQRYVTVEPTIVPKTGARYAGNRFHKSKVFIVERLINKLMVPGHKGKKHFKTSFHMTGKANQAAMLLKDAFEVIEKKLKKNPIEVLVRAVENAAPREEIITIEYGGARYPRAVECAPQRRVDVALRQMTQGAYHRCFNSKISMVQALSDEIMAAYSLSSKSQAISKKLELERQSDASR